MPSLTPPTSTARMSAPKPPMLARLTLPPLQLSVAATIIAIGMDAGWYGCRMVRVPDGTGVGLATAGEGDLQGVWHTCPQHAKRHLIIVTFST
jgi:hypothetical protein